MTSENEEQNKLTPQAEKLLSVLRESIDVWMSRSEIAAKISKNRLTPYDIRLLENMAEMGVSEARQAIIKNVVHWQYRAVTSGDE